MRDGPGGGAEVARRFHADCVRPLLDAHLPGLDHVAGRFGTGSDVLGYDDGVSRDHDWGLRLTILVEDDRVAEVRRVLDDRLPTAFDGLPVRFAFSGGAPRHHVEVDSIGGFLRSRLGVDPRSGLDAADWLSFTGQAVLEVVAGPVFHDPDGRFAAVRRLLEHYPPDLRRLVAAADWARIDEELPLLAAPGSSATASVQR